MFVLPKFSLRPFLPLHSSAIKLRHSKRHLVTDILVKNAHQTDGHRGEDQIDQQNVGVVEQIRDIEIVVDLVPEQGKSPDQILGSCQKR